MNQEQNSKTEINDEVATNHLSQLLSPREFARDFLNRKLAAEFAIQVDALNIEVVTAEYTSKKPGEHHFARLIRKANLVDIFINNIRSYHFGIDGGNISLKILSNNDFDDYAGRYHHQRGKRVHFEENKSYPSEIITNLYPKNDSDSSVFRNRLPMSIGQMKTMLASLNAEQLYNTYLDTFWREFGVAEFALEFGASLFQALATQTLEASLTKDDQSLILTFLGKAPEDDWVAKYTDLGQMENYEGPAPEAGYLVVGSKYQSAMLFIRHPASSRVILYIPGNSSPFHVFASDAALKDWVGLKVASPLVLDQIVHQFSLSDQPDDFVFGVRTVLSNMGRYATLYGISQNPAGSDDDARNWNPRERLRLVASPDVFAQCYRRTKERTYSDGSYVISNNADVTKKNILHSVQEIGTVLGIAAFFLVPFATPVISATVTGAFGALGIVQLGIGIDDQIHGKAESVENIVWGALNALPLAGLAGKETRAVSSEISELEHDGALYYTGKTGRAGLGKNSYDLYHPAGSNSYVRSGQILDLSNAGHAVRRYAADALAGQINRALAHLRAQVPAASLVKQIAGREIYSHAGRYFVGIGEAAEKSYYESVLIHSAAIL